MYNVASYQAMLSNSSSDVEKSKNLLLFLQISRTALCRFLLWWDFKIPDLFITFILIIFLSIYESSQSQHPTFVYTVFSACLFDAFSRQILDCTSNGKCLQRSLLNDSVLLIVMALEKAGVFASNCNIYYEMIENKTIAAS